MVTSVALEKSMGEQKRREGNIVLGFEVRSENSRVFFDVKVPVPLEKQRLRPATTGEPRCGEHPNEFRFWGYQFADVLSDREPSDRFRCEVSPDFSKKKLDPTCVRRKSRIRSLGEALKRNFRFVRN